MDVESSLRSQTSASWFARAFAAALLSGAIPVLGVFLYSPMGELWWSLVVPCGLFMGLPFIGACLRQISPVTILPNLVLGLWFLLIGFPFGLLAMIGLSLWAAGAMHLMADSFGLTQEVAARHGGRAANS